MANDRISFVAPALLLTFATLAGAAHASGGAPEPASCRFTAFVEETDPAGLNVRAAPSATAKVLGTLPPVWSDGSGLRVRVRVEVTGVRNGWFQIRDAADEDVMTGEPPRPTYGGEGWVSGNKLIVKSQAEAGHARPDAKSPASLRFKDGSLFDGSDMMAAGRLADCQGRWVLVDYDLSRVSADVRQLLDIAPAARAGRPKGHVRAWMDRICGIQETSCDGPSSLDDQ
jgi:hypothetical protein